MTYRLTTLGAVLGFVIASAVPAATAPQEAKAAAGGMGEGVQVHGRWTIDIRNPDGTVASHHEFDNALVTTSSVAVPGNAVLAGLLGRAVTIGHWKVSLTGPGGPCGTSAPRVCELVEAAPPAPADNIFNTLRMRVPFQNVQLSGGGLISVPVGTVELAGQATAARDGAITSVLSGLEVLGCLCGGVGQFTQHTLDAPIPIAVDQVVVVKVVLSFS